jgi:hypothetical protein
MLIKWPWRSILYKWAKYCWDCGIFLGVLWKLAEWRFPEWKFAELNIPRIQNKNWKLPEIENWQKIKIRRKWRFAENEDSQKMKIPRIVNQIRKFPESKDSQNIKKLYFLWLPKWGCRGRQPPEWLQGAWRINLQGSGGSSPLLGYNKTYSFRLVRLAYHRKMCW